MLYNIVTKVTPPVPNWVLSWFNETTPEKVSFWFYVGLIIAVLIVAFILTGFERRYGTLLNLSFASWLTLYRPGKAGLLNLDFPENPLFKDGFITFLGSPGGFGLFLQLVFGLVILVTLIRFIIQAFIVYPLKYKTRQHEGSHYKNQAAKEQQRLKKQQTKQQRKQLGNKQQSRPKKKAQQAPPEQQRPQAPPEPTVYTDERGNENDIDFYL